jgi:hypothetical protein
LLGYGASDYVNFARAFDVAVEQNIFCT